LPKIESLVNVVVKIDHLTRGRRSNIGSWKRRRSKPWRFGVLPAVPSPARSASSAPANRAPSLIGIGACWRQTSNLARPQTT